MSFFSKRVNTGARLDYIFVSGVFLNQVREASILRRTTSDHNPISVQIDSGRNPRGRGYWKLPESLLEVEKYTEHIKGKIQDELKKAEFVSPMVRWDMVKACVRRESIRYVKWDGIEDKLKNEEFQAKLADLYFLRDNSPHIEAGVIQKQIENTSKEWNLFLEEANSKRIAYCIGRKHQQDQKSSKYFFHKFNAIPGSTTQIYDPQGVPCTEDKDILEVCRAYYNKLFNKADIPGDIPYAFIPEPHTPPLINDEKRELLNEEITVEELFQALKGMKKGKAPGLDGLPAAFYTKFWDLVGPLLLQSFTCAREQGILAPSHRRGVIKLLPKKGKNPHFVGNLCPITLLNVDLKILTRALSLRISPILDDIVQKEQQAFVKGRYLGNCFLDLQAMATRALEEDDDYLAISLDIEKAFDSVKWQFVNDLLKANGFPPAFLDWIELMQKGKELRLFNNGHSSQTIFVSNGLAQGDSLSPFIFIICMEALA